MNDENHRPVWRKMTFINRADNMFAHAAVGEISHVLGMEERVIPVVSFGHGNGHRLLRLNADLYVSTVRSRPVNTAGVLVARSHRAVSFTARNPCDVFCRLT